jgi:polyhydroxyalkanoate synthesis regulator phasin
VNAVLSAFKEAVEESFQDARDRGDLSTERARELVQGALSRAREAAGEAKERLDFVGQREFDELSERVEDLRARLERLENRASEEGRGGSGEP